MMNYASIKKTDIANGPGVRVSLFVSGCTHMCRDCFNSEAWDFSYGQPFDESAMDQILEALKPDYISGFSVLGGEPFEPQNQTCVLEILRRVRTAFPDGQKTIWCYTGYELEKDLFCWIDQGNTAVADMLSLIDVLVDGEFVAEKKNLKLKFRGSENQRLLSAKESLRQRQAVAVKVPD